MIVFYKSKYIIRVAQIAAHNAKKLAVETTAVVVPDHVTIDPMHSDSMNWARNTILLTIAISVPRPLICAWSGELSAASMANWNVLF